MATVNKFGTTRLLDPAHTQFHGQERVNAEIFTAMELLGRKLERAESERDRLARRLALIESAATVDERTGKLYLPVLMDQALPSRVAESAPPKWVAASSLTSGLIAFFALGLVLFQNSAPALTKEQLTLLDNLKSPRFTLAAPENKPWKSFATTTPVLLPDAVKTEAVPEVVLSEDEIAATPPAIESAAENNVVENKDIPVVATAASADPLPDSSLPENLKQLETRAYQGIPEAQHDLAALYASGKSVARDYPRAIYWFGQAADGGVANAHYNLGVIYQQGLGVKPDMHKAIAWYEKAAELGHPEAMYNLGIAYIQGVGVKTNIERGVSYFKRAANAGVVQAAYNLGVLYESNFIGAIDTGKALEWYKLAAAKGHAEAHDAVSRLETATDQASTLENTVEPAAGE
ncbi:MAG: sel1 repeat family protein [Alphaproteobacteria bacterium]|nr:sel1 repeat family protein [Alphaproteobacteria bacterium]